MRATLMTGGVEGHATYEVHVTSVPRAGARLKMSYYLG
jgi:hypothetical protein